MAGKKTGSLLRIYGFVMASCISQTTGEADQMRAALISLDPKTMYLRRIYVGEDSTYIKFRKAILQEGMVLSLTLFPTVTWPLKIAAIQATTHNPQS